MVTIRVGVLIGQVLIGWLRDDPATSDDRLIQIWPASGPAAWPPSRPILPNLQAFTNRVFAPYDPTTAT